MGVQIQLCGKMGHVKHKSVLVTTVLLFQIFVCINSQECSSSHTSEADRTSCEPIATIQNLEDHNNYRNGIFTSPDQVWSIDVQAHVEALEITIIVALPKAARKKVLM